MKCLEQVLGGWQDAWDRDAEGSYGCVMMMFAYEWKNALEALPQTPKDDLGFPSAMLVACRDLLVWDHFAKNLSVHCSYDTQENRGKEDAVERLTEIRECLLGNKGTRYRKFGDIPRFGFINRECVPWNFRYMSPYCPNFPEGWKSNMSREQFLNKVRRIQEYIAAGDIYQANLSQRFSFGVPVDGLELYAALRQINPSPFAGYMETGDWELISCSPERLIAKEGRVARTRPIAGTRPRSADASADYLYERELLSSPKERSEHIMLVDLERNDLGRVCEKGTVRVDEIMEIEKYSHVQHIVSNVTGSLADRVTFGDILRAVFPGGTITGVPKIRCMQILDELEPTVRGPYTGSFGYFDSRGDFDLNIAIRTMLKMGNAVSVQTGAGIVADSDPAAEYQETLDKAKAMALAVEGCSAKIAAHT